jgi:uncharacterized membrane protein
MASGAPASREGRERVIASRKSGNVRFVDVAYLVERAKSFGVQITLDRRIGHFVPAGAAILRVVDAARITAEREARLLTAIDVGPTRTMQQDVEFGIVQIVDIALRAISPAVNDPTTAINCIDQLCRILILWTSRAASPSYLHAPPHVLRVAIPWIDYEGLLDTAFEQIRHYAKSDIAVSLRLLRAFDDMIVAGATPREQQSLITRARRVAEGCELNLPEHDVLPLQRRLAWLEGRLPGQEARTGIKAAPSP